MRTPLPKALFDWMEAMLSAAAFAEENEPATARWISRAGTPRTAGEIFRSGRVERHRERPHAT